jgi:hypothetical protein
VAVLWTAFLTAPPPHELIFLFFIFLSGYARGLMRMTRVVLVYIYIFYIYELQADLYEKGSFDR